jgi:SAM-dependent methyltransferase
MSLVSEVHGRYVHSRRVRVLGRLLAELLPPQARVLDVGCGDGRLSRLIGDLRPDIAIEGVDVLVRGETEISVTWFDGRNLPMADASFDAVVCADVLHHAEDPLLLLSEMQRVAGQALVIKDHTLNGPLAGPTLRFMDRVGNARHGVALPYHYWTREQWLAACRQLGLKIDDWTSDLKLYPRPADWIFGRSLHFVARLLVAP